jgi:hypothetical protein
VYGARVRLLDGGTRFEVGPPAASGPLHGLPRYYGTLRGPEGREVVASIGAGLRCAA